MRLRQRGANGEPLDRLLPEAFALARETSARVLGQRPYDVQVLGGCVLHDGQIAEMATGALAPRAPLSWSLSPEEHMAAVQSAVASAADGIQAALTKDDFFSRTNFLDARSVQAMAEEARRLDATLVPSQSTRWDGTRTVAYDKAGVRSTQILGGSTYAMAPRLTEYVVALTKALGGAVNAGPSLRKLSEQEQTNKLAVCDAVAAAYPKHIDNGGGDDPRLLTAILYLAGCPAGGEFRAYAPTEDRVVESVTPAPGSFVCFWSDRLVHDVAEVSRCDGPGDARWALTVWLCAAEPGVVEDTPPAVLAAHWPDAAA